MKMEFVDYHAHVYGTGYKVLHPKLDGMQSIEAIQTVVQSQKQAQSEAKGENWILLRGWDQNLWEEKIFPTRFDLDSVSAEIPIALIRIDGHALWCNTKALQIAGIGSASLPLAAREDIVKDKKGEPTGILIDDAMKLVYDAMPPEGEEKIISTLRAGLKEFAKHHIAVFDMGIPREWWEPFKKLYASEGDSLIKSYVFLDMTKETGRALFLEKVKSGTFDDSPHPNLKLIGIKLYLDGALGSRGANLFEDYSDDKGNRGIRLMEGDEALMLMNLAAERGLQIAVHAIGDAANARALDLFAKVREHLHRNPPPANSTPILRIEHAQIVREQDIHRFKELGVWAIVQPQFYASDKEWAVGRLGKERMKDAYRWRSLISAGVKVAASSDSPIEEADPNRGIQALLIREGEGVSGSTAYSLYSPIDELLP
jgi:hypothetical protein